MSSIHILNQIDKNQIFRFFVDGRFHKKYKGWRGYENNEPGSVGGMLAGLSYLADNFDLSCGVSTHYIIRLHKLCMLNVHTKNKKSTPGELRYLEAGFQFYAGQTTISSLAEIFEMRRGDGTHLFHTKGFAKTAEELDLLETYQAIHEIKKLRFRPWYPNLDIDMKNALEKRGSLEDFYKVKNYIQMNFASRMESITVDFNRSIEKSANKSEKLLSIAKLVRDLELLHPFPDGNCRVFVCLLMNHLLMFHGFHPAILLDPNLDAEYSYAEFALEISKGIENTMLLLDDPGMTLFNYSISESSKKDKDDFLELAQDLIAKIKQSTHKIRGKSHNPPDEEGIYLTPDILASITNGKWFNYDPDLTFTGVGSHNTFRKGYLYFCLSLADWIKDNKNVTEEIEKVYRKGARGIVIDDEQYLADIEKPALLVDDIDRAFRDSAVTARQEVDCKAVLLTGTVGKTGCKIQLHHCLKGQTRVHATLNSANTKIPVLWSLANLKKDDKVEINEVSVGGGENIGITRSQMVKPDICMFTSIGPNHMDIHKTIENLINAKSAVVAGLKGGGLCVVNSSDDLSPQLINAIKKRTNAPVLTFGSNQDDTARLLDASFDTEKFGWNIKADIDGENIEYFVPLFHQHAPLMSVGTLLTIKKLGFDVRQAASDYDGIEPFETMGRLFKIFIDDGSILFYDQSRRGSIQGMKSAFNDMKNFKPAGKIVALLGGVSVGKNNEWAEKFNKELARLVNESHIEKLYTTGKFMNYVHDNLEKKSILVKHSNDLDELANDLMSEVKAEDLLFIMGSAYLYLGRVATRILNKYQHERLR